MNARRWTICLVANHKWAKVPYSKHDDSGKFLRCRRCGHEDHNSYGTIATGSPLGM
jgi:hypothetical protein